MSGNRMSSSPKRIYQAARYLILALVAFTVVNVVLTFLDSDSYYVTSVFASYFFVVGLESALGYVLGALILVPFVLAFIFSNKKWIWLVVALVLVVLDLLFLIVIGLMAEELASAILDLIAHAAVIVILILGIVKGRAATAEPVTAPAADAPAEAAADAVPQRATQEGQEGPFTDVICTVAVSQDGQKHSMEGSGLVRFYENEVAIGMTGMVQSMLIGSAFAPTKEQLRFGYADIARVFYARKNERTVRLDLNDGRYAYLVVNGAAKQQLNTLLNAHGITIEPFAG